MDPQTPPPPLDPASVLLPKKEVAAPAARINAGALLAQEQVAELPKTAPTPAPAVQAPMPAPGVASLQTYRGDIEKAVEGGASIVSMASAEARRRAEPGREPTSAPAPVQEHGAWKKAIFIIAGILLLALAGGAVAFVLTRNTTTPGPAAAPQAPFLSVDDTKVVSVATPATRANLMSALQTARSNTKLPLGLVGWLYPARTATDGTLQGLSAQDFLLTLAPNVPANFLRTVQPTYLLGVHSYDENQAFLLLQVDAYEVSYAGMLEWERTLQGDLSPLFIRTPSPRLQTQVGSLTATSSQAFIPSNFVDKIVENRDTRVLLNPKGDILLLWTMLGRNIVLITTNEATLREVISKMNVAPTIPTPGK